MAKVYDKTTAINACKYASNEVIEAAFAGLNTITESNDPLINNGAPNATLLAAEQIAHFISAWQYGCSAIQAYMNNSKDLTTHLAYYAELRAALSLFSGSGIRINTKGFYLNSNKQKKKFYEPTHKMAWATWENWTGRADALKLIGSIRCEPSLSLDEVQNAIGLSTLGKSSMQNWGLDLVSIDKDHTARNLASYEPSLVKNQLDKMSLSDNKLISNIWHLLRPEGPGILSFDTVFIQYTLRQLALDRFNNLQTDSDINNYIAWKENIVKTLSSNIGLNESTIESQLDDSSTRHLFELFDLAADKKTDPENVLCRAFFMIRLATLRVMKNLSNSSNQNKSGYKWIKNWLTNAGILEENAEYDSILDIYEDYNLALEEYDETNFNQLPHDNWNIANCFNSSLLCRPDAAIAWSIGFPT